MFSNKYQRRFWAALLVMFVAPALLAADQTVLTSFNRTGCRSQNAKAETRGEVSSRGYG